MFNNLNKQVRRTREWIFNALLSLLGKKPYEEIKIGNITDEAGVARQSFYRNYDSKEDIVIKYFGNLYEEYAEAVRVKYSSGEDAPDYAELYSLFFSKLLEHKDELLTLKNASLSRLMYNALWQYGNRINDSFYPDGAHPDEKLFYEYFIKYQLGGIITLTIEWIERDMDQSPEELGAIIERITEPFDASHSFLPIMIKKIIELD